MFITRLHKAEFMKKTLTRGILLGCAIGSSFSGCDDILLADPQKSTCQAYCEWAVACHSEAREVNDEDLLATCLRDTQAENKRCVEMETKGIPIPLSLLYERCTDKIDSLKRSNDCGPFTGDAVEINTSTSPLECTSVADEDIDVFNTARLATAESNDALCERMSKTLCERSTGCLSSEYNVPDQYLSGATPPAQERCLDRFETAVTNSCKSEGLYAISSAAPTTEEPVDGKADIDIDLDDVEDVLPTVFFSVNPNREAARACLESLSGLACGELFSGTLPPVCAGAFSDPTEVVGAMNGFVCGLERPELAAVCE